MQNILVLSIHKDFNNLSLDKMSATSADDIFKYIFTNEKFWISIRRGS